jgi:glutamate-1-semialdehyde 2,1-aminomutase
MTVQTLDATLKDASDRFAAKRPRTRAMQERAAHVMPGGNTRTVLFTAPFPIRIERGEGATLTDIDGHRCRELRGDYSAGI